MTRTRSQKQRAKIARQQQVANRRTTVTTVVNKMSQPRRRRSNAIIGRGRLPARHFELSLCAKKYLQAIENPFSGITACVPTVFNQPSLKANIYSKGTFTTGTMGFGAILVSPAVFAWQYDNINPINSVTTHSPILYTTSNYQGIDTSLLPATANVPALDGVEAAQSNTAFAYEINLRNRARLVSCGLRVRNVTPMLNRGGIGCMLEMPNHNSALNRTMNGLRSYPTCGPIDMNGKWSYVTWHPLDEDEHDWYTASVANSRQVQDAASASSFYYNLGCAIQSPPNTPQTFEFEVYGVFEYAGSNIQGVTPTDSDPAGLGYVSQAFRTIQDRRPTTNIAAEVQNSLYKATLAGMQAVGLGAARGVISYFTQARSNQRATITYPGPIVEEMD